MDIQRETIYQLLMLKLTDSLKETEESYINSLIESEPEVYALWNEIKADFAVPRQQEALQAFDTEEMMASVREEIRYRKKRRVRKSRSLFFAIAVLLGTGGFFLFREPTTADLSGKVVLQLANGEQIALSDSAGEQTPGDMLALGVNTKRNTTGTVIVPAGKSYRFKLADGTAVMVNSGSKLTFPFSFTANKREISIAGEAFLKVAANPGLPFTVHTQHTDIQVLGTSFNVNSYDSGIVKISLVEGAVKMQTGSHETLLKPGYQATATNKGTETRPFDEEQDLAWMKDQYIFRHSRLDEVIPVLERWYNVRIVFDNQTAAGKVVTGHIVRSDEIHTVLDMLKIISNINYYYKEDIIHIK
jgi:hypothetical protein